MAFRPQRAASVTPDLDPVHELVGAQRAAQLQPAGLALHLTIASASQPVVAGEINFRHASTVARLRGITAASAENRHARGAP